MVNRQMQTPRGVKQVINPQDVYLFVNSMRQNYNAGFIEQPLQNGVRLTGEYYTHSGQLLTITFAVTYAKVETKIYDSARRLIFNDSTTKNINHNTRLIQFIQRSINAY